MDGVRGQPGLKGEGGATGMIGMPGLKGDRGVPGVDCTKGEIVFFKQNKIGTKSMKAELKTIYRDQYGMERRMAFGPTFWDFFKLKS